MKAIQDYITTAVQKLKWTFRPFFWHFNIETGNIPKLNMGYMRYAVSYSARLTRRFPIQAVFSYAPS